MSAAVLGIICVALILSGAWFGSTLVKAGRIGVGVGVFLGAALIAGIVTDNIR